MNILIAEDEPMIRELLEIILEAEGYTLHIAENGKQALELWNENQIDLICLDIMMPELDGYSVCRKIRETDQTTPILFLSAKTEEESVVQGLEIGANDFIRKPFGKQEVVARIKLALRNSPTDPALTKPRTKTYSIGKWQLIIDELRMTSGKTSVDLTTREVSILIFFQKHLGKVITRDQLLDACWGINFLPESRTLDQQISRLRKKLDDKKGELITTVHGTGYRMQF